MSVEMTTGGACTCVRCKKEFNLGPYQATSIYGPAFRACYDFGVVLLSKDRQRPLCAACSLHLPDLDAVIEAALSHKDGASPQAQLVREGALGWPGDTKRLYMPGWRVKTACPKCGKRVSRSLENDYPSRDFGNVGLLYFQCEATTPEGTCDHEWQVVLAIVPQVVAG
ncbi:hypothetical protein EBT31_13475 [bacterium]|nr:hypothetical protein [bacterium]